LPKVFNGDRWGAMTFNMTIFNITTLSILDLIVTLNIMDLIGTLSIITLDISIKCLMLTVIMLRVITIF
jgi:hypothetical protein